MTFQQTQQQTSQQEYYTDEEEEQIKIRKRRFKCMYKIIFKPNIHIIGTKPLSNFGTLIRKEHNFWKNPARRRRRRAIHFSNMA